MVVVVAQAGDRNGPVVSELLTQTPGSTRRFESVRCIEIEGDFGAEEGKALGEMFGDPTAAEIELVERSRGPRRPPTLAPPLFFPVLPILRKRRLNPAGRLSDSGAAGR